MLGFYRIGGREYYFELDNKESYDDADSSCMARNASLASIDSFATFDVLQSLAIDLTSIREFWLGGRFDEVSGHELSWADSTPTIDWTLRFKDGEPNNRRGKEDCLLFNSRNSDGNPSGTFEDRNCVLQRFFVRFFLRCLSFSHAWSLDLWACH